MKKTKSRKKSKRTLFSKEELAKLKSQYKSRKLKFNSKDISKALFKDLKNKS